MYFKDIIDQLTNIIIVYYIEYRNKHKIDKNEQKDIRINVDELHIYVKSTLISWYLKRYPEEKNDYLCHNEIYSISILDFPLDEEEYIFGYSEDIDYTPLTDDIIEHIIYNLKLMIDEHDYIDNDTIVLSINTCPFDGFIIKHYEIIQLVDLYFY